MNIEVIAEHSVDVDLLTERSNVLDIGCRGFLFTNEMRRLGHTVYPIDVDILEGYQPSKDYIRVAITGIKEQRVGVKRTSDPQATSVIPGDEIWTHTIESFSELSGVDFWDVVKIDVEGSEYDIIMCLTKPPARQLSIEFHLHTGVYGESEILLMENKLLSLGYFPVKHDKTKQHGLSYNFWDSLWVLV